VPSVLLLWVCACLLSVYICTPLWGC